MPSEAYGVWECLISTLPGMECLGVRSAQSLALGEDGSGEGSKPKADALLYGGEVKTRSDATTPPMRIASTGERTVDGVERRTFSLRAPLPLPLTGEARRRES